MLTTRTRVSELLQISVGISEQEFNRYLREAGEFDLKELMTEEFYHDLTANKTAAKYKKLIDGGTYGFEGRNYTFSGIDRVLAYFIYARIMMYGNVVTTSHGVVVKKTPDSNPLMIEERKNFYYAHKAQANKIFEGVKKYIERNIADYPSWEQSCNITTSFKTRVIQ